MALDKNFLKYKLEKIKNEDIYKDQDSQTKKKIRKENSKKAAKEAEAIHSYLTGMDPIRPLMNRSFIDPDSMPGNIAIDEKTGQLNVTQVKTASVPKLPALPGLMGSMAANAQKSKGLKILKRLFDSLNIVFKPKKLSIDKDFESKGQVNVGKNIIIGGSGTINQGLIVNGDGEIGGGLLVKRNVTINKKLVVKDDTSVEKNIIVGENTTIGKDLNVQNDGVVGGNLNVLKDENIQGNLNVGNDGEIEENLSVGKNVNISGNSNVRGISNVTAVSNTMGIHNVGMALNVMGPAIFGGGLIIAPFPIPPIPGMPKPPKASADLTVKGNIIGSKKLNLSGEMNVGGNGIIDGRVRVGKSIDVRGNINLRGNENVNGDLNVNGILNLGESSINDNGYTTLPNGLIFQWGTDTRNSDEAYVIEFPTTFPNGCFSVTVNRQAGNDDGDNKTWSVTATTITSTGFTIDRHDDISGEQTINYMAIGN